MASMRTFARETHGLATVEVAIVLPFLLILTFGMLQYGWLFFRYHQVTNAAHRGARIAILPSAATADVQDKVQELMEYYGMADTGYLLSTLPGEVSDAVGLDTVTVEVSVPYEAIAPFGAAFVPLPEHLTAKVSMAREGTVDAF